MKKIIALTGIAVLTVICVTMGVCVSKADPQSEALVDTTVNVLVAADESTEKTTEVVATEATTTTKVVEEKTKYENVYYVYKPETHYVHFSTCEWAEDSEEVFRIDTTKGLKARLCEDCHPALKVHNEYVVETTAVKTITNTTTKTETYEEEEVVVEEVVEEIQQPQSGWSGQRLTRNAGKIQGPSGTETYYNLDMSGIVSVMRGLGYDAENYPYWVREDGAKMLGSYVMVAANLSIRPRGTILPCSLGMAIVCDTGGFVNWDSTRLDLACQW